MGGATILEEVSANLSTDFFSPSHMIVIIRRSMQHITYDVSSGKGDRELKLLLNATEYTESICTEEL